MTPPGGQVQQGQLILLFVLGVSLFHTVASQPCDAACQARQNRSLLRLYNATGGADWLLPQPWANNATITFRNGTLPEHCSWYRVVCCTLDGQFGTSGQGPGPWILDNTTTQPCTTPGAVLTLALQLANLRGSLPAEMFANLTTLTNLDLSGEPDRGQILR